MNGFRGRPTTYPSVSSIFCSKFRRLSVHKGNRLQHSGDLELNPGSYDAHSFNHGNEGVFLQYQQDGNVHVIDFI